MICYRTVVLQVLWAQAPDQHQVQILYRRIQRWTDLAWSSSSLCCYCMPTSANDDSKSLAPLKHRVSCHIVRQWRMCSTIFRIARMGSHAMVSINTNQQLMLNVSYYFKINYNLFERNKTIALLFSRVTYTSSGLSQKMCKFCFISAVTFEYIAIITTCSSYIL